MSGDHFMAIAPLVEPRTLGGGPRGSAAAFVDKVGEMASSLYRTFYLGTRSNTGDLMNQRLLRQNERLDISRDRNLELQREGQARRILLQLMQDTKRIKEP